MPIDWEKLQRKVLTVFVLLVMGYFAMQAAAYFHDVLTIIVTAIIIAYLLHLVVEPLARWMPRLAAVAIVTAGFAVTAGLVVALLVPLVLQQLRMLMLGVPQKLVELQALSYQYQAKLSTHHITISLDNIYAWFFPKIERWSQHLGDNVPGLLVGSFMGFFSVAMVLVCAFYFLKDGREIWAALLSLFPMKNRERLEHLRIMLDSSLHQYFLGQVINASVVLVLSSIAFSLLRMDFGLVAGGVWGILEVIPYFGTYIGIGIALMLASWQGGSLVIKILIAALIIQQLKDNVIAPRVMSHTTGLHPILIVMAVLVGGKLAGFLGVLLAIPVMAVLVGLLYFYAARHARALDTAQPPHEEANPT